MKVVWLSKKNKKQRLFWVAQVKLELWIFDNKCFSMLLSRLFNRRIVSWKLILINFNYIYIVTAKQGHYMKNLIRLGLLGETSILMLSCMCHALNQFDVNYFNLHPRSLNVSRGNQNCFSQFINFLWKILCNYTELWFFFSDQVYSNTRVPTEVNTNQHESTQ